MLSVLFSSLQARAPSQGRFWVMLPSSVVSRIFEGEKFTCCTSQPGCTEVRQDAMLLFSSYRFWVCQIILILTPSLLFFIYMAHRKKDTAAHDDGENRRPHWIYIISVVFWIIIEAPFVIGQWWLYGFKVEASYTCRHRPCHSYASCFIAGSKEKTTFLCFFFAVGILSVISSLAELLQVIRYVH
nr:gap junction delta-2 protein-like [Paramormyrops kingsleyae]